MCDISDAAVYNVVLILQFKQDMGNLQTQIIFSTDTDIPYIY